MALSEANRKRLWVIYFGVLISWACNAYPLVFSWLSEGNLFARYIGGKPYILDFILHYEAGELGATAKSKGINIYDPKIQDAEVNKLVAPAVPEVPFYLQYPPLFFVLCIPFVWVPLNWSWICWNIIGLGLTFASILPLCYKQLGKGFGLVFATTAVIASFPVWICFELGQTSFFLLAGLSLFFWLNRREKYFLAGLSTFFLMVKVQYLPYVVVIGLIRGRLKYASGALLAGLIALVLSILVLGWNNCIEWPRILLHAETGTVYSGVSPEQQQNIRGMLNLILGGDTQIVRVASAGLCLLSVLAIGYLWTKPYQKLQIETGWASHVVAAVSLMTMLLFSVHTHRQDYCLFVLACVWLYFALADKKSAPGVRWLKWLILAFPIVSWLLYMLSFLSPFLHIQPFATYLLVVLVLALKVWILPSQKTDAAPVSTEGARD